MSRRPGDGARVPHDEKASVCYCNRCLLRRAYEAEREVVWTITEEILERSVREARRARDRPR